MQKNIFQLTLILALALLAFGACEELVKTPNSSFSIVNLSGQEVSTVKVGDTVRFTPDDLAADFYSIWPGDSLHIFGGTDPYVNPEDTTDITFDRGLSFSPENDELYKEYSYDKAGSYTVVMVVTNVDNGELKRSESELSLSITE